MFNVSSVKISGFEVHPIVEGGKGIGITNGKTAGSFTKAGAVGTFSGVNADSYDENGNRLSQIYTGKSRKDKHEELISYGIRGGIAQARIAHDISGGKGPVHMNILWEMGGAQRILTGILEGAKGLIHGITCGAGMPYKLSEIAEKFNVYYYPIVSSMRAFRALWKRSYSKNSRLLGGVVYEDPWLAGGHNGLSNSEDPKQPQDPYPRVAEIRQFMNEVGLQEVPIIMAGGVWHLRDYEHWLNNDEIGPISFQFGTRPILTQESPVSDAWKKRLLTLKEGDVFLNRFSPTGFYSSAVNNSFIKELRSREERQVEYSDVLRDNLCAEIKVGQRSRSVYINQDMVENVNNWLSQGFTEAMRTPDQTLIFVAPDKAKEILNNQIDCMGCLSACKFSNWSDHLDNNNTGKKADPRSFCIQKTLQNIVHGDDVEQELMFSGHNAFKFAQDPFYNNGFIPTVKELVDRIVTGY